MSQELITKQSQFLEICDLIKQEKIVALDSEFMRETTYYAVLCLVQIDVAGKCFLIDVLAKDIDLQPFFEILGDEKIIKIFHSSRQDISVLAQISPSALPQSIMDTQIMASLCGIGYDVGYAKLVRILLGEDLDKNWQRSDWQTRPLHKEQIEYAVIDVLHLPAIYQILHERLTAQNKLDWLEEEMKLLVKKAMDDDIYKKFFLNDKSKNYQENVKLLVVWRDELAKKYNVPRGFVIKDKLLDKIAYKNPKNLVELEKCTFETRLVGREIRNEILDLIKDQNFEEVVDVNRVKRDYKMNEKQNNLYQASRALLQKNAKENNVSPELIINQDDLRSIIFGYREIAKILAGWRFTVFGKDLENLIN